MNMNNQKIQIADLTCSFNHFKNLIQYLNLDKIVCHWIEPIYYVYMCLILYFIV